jgi:hypothetical protein
MANEKPSTIPSVTALDGKTTAVDMRFEPQRLSYISASKISTRIASVLSKEIQRRSSRPKKIVIVDTAVLADFTNLAAVRAELKQLVADYKSLAAHAALVNSQRQKQSLRQSGKPVDSTEAATFGNTFKAIIPGAAIALAPAIVGGAAIAPASSLIAAGLGLLSLFRQDVDYHGTDTVVDSLSFKIALASHLKPLAEKVWIADLYLLPPVAGADSLQQLLLDLQAAKSTAWQTIGPLVSELVQFDTALDEAARAKNQPLLDQLTLRVSELRRDLKPVSEPLSRTDQRLANLEKEWHQTDEASGLSGLGRLMRAEAIQRLEPLYLHCAVVSSGGHWRTVRSLLRTLFTGDGIDFLGGAVVRWAILETDGTVAAGGIETETVTSTYGGLIDLDSKV